MKINLLKVICLVMVLLISTGCESLGIGGGGGGNGGGGGGTSVCEKESGISFVTLDRQGSTSYIYNNDNVVDPLAFCPTKQAKVSKVTNSSGYNMSLAHGGPGSPFIILNAGNSTTAFNGQLVEGNWSAQYAGNVNSAPSQMTAKVEWTRP